LLYLCSKYSAKSELMKKRLSHDSLVKDKNNLEISLKVQKEEVFKLRAIKAKHLKDIAK